MQTITAVKANGTIWYLWDERDGFFTNYSATIVLALAHELENPYLRARFKRDPHNYGFRKRSEITTKHSGGNPILFPVLMDDDTRIFELLADNTDDFSWDNEFELSVSPDCQWVWLLDLDDNTFSVYGGYKLLIDRTHHRNYDIQLELQCDGIPCFMVELWMLDTLPDVQTLKSVCAATSCA